MCRMTDMGTRWKRHIDLPDFGEEATYWALSYAGETRYTRKPQPFYENEVRAFVKPLYAIRVRSRSI